MLPTSAVQKKKERKRLLWLYIASYFFCVPSLALGTNISNLQLQFLSLRSNKLSLKWLHNLSFITQNSENSVTEKLTTASKKAVNALDKCGFYYKIWHQVIFNLLYFPCVCFKHWISLNSSWVVYQSKKSQNMLSLYSEILKLERQ